MKNYRGNLIICGIFISIVGMILASYAYFTKYDSQQKGVVEYLTQENIKDSNKIALDNTIKFIQYSTLDENTDVTLRELYDKSFTNVSWGAVQSENSVDVSIKGKFLQNGTDIDVVVTYRVNNDNSFYPNKVVFGNKEMTSSERSNFIEDLIICNTTQN